MMPLDDLLAILGYDKSPYYRSTDAVTDPQTAHIFRIARSAGVRGIYVFEASPSPARLLSPRPAVYIAEANDEQVAVDIHRKLWNLGCAPFLVIRLPHQIRVYTGFNYSPQVPDAGLLGQAEHLEQIRALLDNLSAASIDTGRIWKSGFASLLDSDQRVDRRLLRNLEDLGNALQASGLKEDVAHTLIGKYIYLRYLRARGILTDNWLEQHRLDPDGVFSLHATVSSLREAVAALEDRLNGRIFPIAFESEGGLEDRHVSWVASVFQGAEVVGTAPSLIQQLALPFRAYDFQYIPVETLSAIYEQFIKERKEKGAIYTPEVLADYLLSEVEWAKPLQRGMRVLDPACGSGVFLVLVYRRLIEREMARLGRPLEPTELRAILQESICGVERELDACYVAEFSLILTLLHYAGTFDLQDLDFQFPSLHNTQIFHSDFFDLEGQENGAQFWQHGLRFDWIVGNPPWIELKPTTAGQKFIRAWMDDPDNKLHRPVGGRRAAEAFSWLVTNLLDTDGVVGLVMPATSLFNLESRAYRRRFFSDYEVLRVTDFANLREVLFGKGKSGVLPAATIIYKQADDAHERPDIVHYGPLSISQIGEVDDRPWVITVNESEVQLVSPSEAATGESSVWKFALWGTYRDKRVMERLRSLFPTTLAQLCGKRGWSFYQGVELLSKGAKQKKKYHAELCGKKRFQTPLMRKSLFSLSVPQQALEDIPIGMCYIRERGGQAGLTLTPAPHVIISPVWMSYIAYSDEDFVIPPRQMGIAAPSEDAEYLRALSVYLNSSLVAYYLFFYAQQWGVFRQARLVSIQEVRRIPTPELGPGQIGELAALQKELVGLERQEILRFLSELQKKACEEWGASGSPVANLPNAKGGTVQFADSLQTRLRKAIDERVFDLFKIPEDIRVMVEDFVQSRLILDKPSAMANALVPPSEKDLLLYAKELRDELDAFAMGAAHHRVTITYSSELIECLIEITDANVPIPIDANSVRPGTVATAKLLAEIGDKLTEPISQWVYIRRGLRLFDGPRIYLYKAPRLIDWLRTQAMNDASDIIGEVITAR